MVNMQDKLYYMGGERATDTEANQPRKNVYWLDPSTNDPWKETSSLNEARNGMSAAVIDNKIYVFSGAGGGQGPGGPGGPPPNMNGRSQNDTTHRQPPSPPPPREEGPRPPSPLEVFTLK